MGNGDTDKLVTWPGMMSFTYHPTGSLKEQKNTGGTVQKTWAYTGAELISAVTHAGVASPSSMAWDADSNRVSFTSSTGGTWEYVYDTTAGIPAVIEEVTPSGSVYYIREPGGALIARIDGATTNYYHFDELGSTRMLTNGSGTVTDTYTYDAWGKQIASTGSTAQPYRYVGQLGYYSHHQDTNLFSQNGYQFLQLGVRFYDVLAGRFTQRDPIYHVGRSSYVYSAANPTSFVDPRGEDELKICYNRGALVGTHAFMCVNGSCTGFNPGGSWRDILRGRGQPDHKTPDDSSYKDKNGNSTVSCCTVTISHCKAECLAESMKAHEYDIYAISGIGGKNCATWIATVLNECGYECVARYTPINVPMYCYCLTHGGRDGGGPYQGGAPAL